MVSRGSAWIAASACVLGIVVPACGDPRPPNVVLITIDTLRADHTSLHGYERDTTPFLAEWARGGTVFERAYSPSSWTLPAMSMILTGQVQVKNEGRIFPVQTSLAEVFRERGYRTGAVVANRLLTDERGFSSGFDDYRVLEPKVKGQPVAHWLAPQVNARAFEFLDRGREPFFLFLHYFDPHNPYRPIGEHRFDPWNRPDRRRAFRDAMAAEHAGRLDDAAYAGIEDRIALYDAEVRQVDEAFAELMTRLDREGLADNTLVIVTADHGEGLWQRAVNKDDKLKEGFFPFLYFEHGTQLYEEQVHVPLVLRGPGVPNGLRVDDDVSLLDVAPTMLSLLDLPRPGAMVGEALLPELPPSGRSIFSICSRGTTVKADGRFRLHQPRDYRLKKGIAPELYDLGADPAELERLQDAERERELGARIEAWLAAHEDIDWDAEPLSLEDVERDLGALGYTIEDMMGEDAEQEEDGDETHPDE